MKRTDTPRLRRIKAERSVINAAMQWPALFKKMGALGVQAFDWGKLHRATHALQKARKL